MKKEDEARLNEVVHRLKGVAFVVEVAEKETKDVYMGRALRATKHSLADAVARLEYVLADG